MGNLLLDQVQGEILANCHLRSWNFSSLRFRSKYFDSFAPIQHVSIFINFFARKLRWSTVLTLKVARKFHLQQIWSVATCTLKLFSFSDRDGFWKKPNDIHGTLPSEIFITFWHDLVDFLDNFTISKSMHMAKSSSPPLCLHPSVSSCTSPCTKSFPVI